MSCLIHHSASFLAPDIPPDLYEWIENPAIEDIEWQQWLTDLMRTDKSLYTICLVNDCGLSSGCVTR